MESTVSRFDDVIDWLTMATAALAIGLILSALATGLLFRSGGG